jgi:hypothetical protein
MRYTLLRAARGLLVLAAIFVLLSPTSASAAFFWKNAIINGNWSIGNNWSAVSAAGADNAGVPTAGGAVNIVHTDGTPRTVIYDAVTAPNLGSMSIDLTGAGSTVDTLSMSGGNNLNAAGLFVGGYNGISATPGRGALTQSAGTTTVASGTDLVIGDGASSTGTYTLSGGALIANQSEYVGMSGNGTFTQSAGTNTINASTLFLGLFIGAGSGSTGTYNLNNAATLTVNNSVFIGRNGGSGSFNQTGGTTMIVGANDNLYVGFNGGGNGTYTLSGGSLQCGFIESVSNGANGTLNQTGGTNTTVSLQILPVPGTTGTYTLSGGSATINGNAYLGYSGGGAAVLTVSGTGVLTISPFYPLTVTNTPGTSLNLSGGTINVGGLNFNGVPGAFNWTSGTLNVTNSVVWDPAAAPTSTSAAFGPARTVGNNQVLMITGDETLGGSGGFSLTLDSGGTNTVTGATTIAANSSLTLRGGTLNTGTLIGNGTFSFIAGTLSINQAGATISMPIVTGNPSTININADNVSLGSASSFTGFNHQGVLNVGANTVTLNSAGYAKLGVLTTFSGGTINAPNGVYISGGGSVQGSGAINARVTGDAGSVIEATGALALGDAASPAGFNYQGELRTKQFTVTLNSSDTSTLGNLTSLGNGAGAGTLNATNGFFVDFGKGIAGYGTINSANTLAQHATINGTVQGSSMAQPITLSGYIKGTGTFNNAVFTGTHDPGLSPTLLQAGNIAYASIATLILELGGTSRNQPTQYDAIVASGALNLGGVLQVSLVNSFTPADGNSFDIFDWGTLTGKFSSIVLPSLNTGSRGWDISQLYTTGVISVTNYIKGDINRDGHVNIADVSALEAALADVSKYQSDSMLTNSQLLAIADLTSDDLVTNADIQGLINYLANNASALPAPGGGELTAVPEPASLVLLAIGFLWYLRSIVGGLTLGTLTTGKV